MMINLFCLVKLCEVIVFKLKVKVLLIKKKIRTNKSILYFQMYPIWDEKINILRDLKGSHLTFDLFSLIIFINLD